MANVIIHVLHFVVIDATHVYGSFLGLTIGLAEGYSFCPFSVKGDGG